MTLIENIKLWHETTRPYPTEQDVNAQLACHIEEFIEMLDAIVFENWSQATVATLQQLMQGLKEKTVTVAAIDPVALLDSLCDQAVTGIGVAHCLSMDYEGALHRVNDSNWSKFGADGLPIRNEANKIVKGPNYVPPYINDLCGPSNVY